VIYGLLCGLVGDLVGDQLGMLYTLLNAGYGGPPCGLAVGLAVGIDKGGKSCFQHLLLRLALVHSRSAPWRYADFLDYAAERIFLRKVGGGYIFIHRLLLEYFAAPHPPHG